MRAIRTWLPLAIILAGIVIVVAVRNENGLEGGLLVISAGLSVWLLNWFYVFSVRGEGDRDREDDARNYYDEHGYWPDEAPPEPEGEVGSSPARPEDVHKRTTPPERHRPRPERRPRRPSA